MSSEPGMEPLDAARLTPPDQRGFGHQCEHGSLSRSCELCWAYHEIALLQREVESLREGQGAAKVAEIAGPGEPLTVDPGCFILFDAADRAEPLTAREYAIIIDALETADKESIEAALMNVADDSVVDWHLGEISETLSAARKVHAWYSAHREPEQGRRQDGAVEQPKGSGIHQG